MPVCAQLHTLFLKNSALNYKLVSFSDLSEFFVALLYDNICFVVMANYKYVLGSWEMFMRICVQKLRNDRLSGFCTAKKKKHIFCVSKLCQQSDGTLNYEAQMGLLQHTIPLLDFS